MRDVVVDRQLHDLRVDQDQLDLLRRGAEQDRRDDGVDAHGLARTGLAGDQHVRHLRDVRHDVAPGVVLAQAHRDAAGMALQHIPEAHHLHLVVGDLDSNSSFSGNRQ